MHALALDAKPIVQPTLNTAQASLQPDVIVIQILPEKP
jgi:hypothetical protein